MDYIKVENGLGLSAGLSVFLADTGLNITLGKIRGWNLEWN